MRACSLNDSLSTKTKMSHIRADPSSFQFGKGCDGNIGGREDLTTCRQAFNFLIPTTSRRRKKNVGVKSQRWHPSIWTNFCQKMPFLILRRFIYSFGPPFLYKQEKYWKYWLQYLAGPAIPNCQRWYWKYWLQNLFQEMCKIIFWTTFP